MISLKKVTGFAALCAALSLPTQAVQIGQQMATIVDAVNPSDANLTSWLNSIINYHNAPTPGLNPFEVTTDPVGQGPELVTIANYSTTDATFAAAVFGKKARTRHRA